MKLLKVLIGPFQIKFFVVKILRKKVSRMKFLGIGYFEESSLRRIELFGESFFSGNQNFPEDVCLLPLSSNPSRPEHSELQVHFEDLVLSFFLLKVGDFDFSSV